MRYGIVVIGCTMLIAGCGKSPPPEAPPDPWPSYKEAIIHDGIQQLQTGDDEQKRWAAFALGMGIFGPDAKEALPALKAALNEENPFVRVQVVKAMIAIDPTGEETQSHFAAATRDEEAMVRFEAAQALGKIGPKAWNAVDELEPLLADDEVLVRQAAAKTLGLIGPKAEKVRPTLLLVSDLDPDDTVRALAEEAIRKIDGQ